MKLEFLGTGTSYGVPQIGCHCEVCISSDPRDNRTRCSLWIRHGNVSIVVDTGPDFRFQCLRSGINQLDAVFFTHFHADHVFGLDDIRQFNTLQKKKIPIYVPDFMTKRFVDCFGYTISSPGPGLNRPRLLLNTISDSCIKFGEIAIQPVNIWHGKEPVKGYIFEAESKKIAYLVDCKTLPKDTIEKVTHSDVIILSALWRKSKSHPTHLNLDEAVKLSQQLKGERTYLTHMTHTMGLHEETSKILPKRISLAYDGLKYPGDTPLERPEK